MFTRRICIALLGAGLLLSACGQQEAAEDTSEPVPAVASDDADDLPAIIHRCVSMDYAMAHPGECNQARLRLSPEERAELRQLGQR